MSYAIVVSKSVQKQIDSLAADLRERITEKLKKLTDEPRPDGVVKLKGSNNEYRLRVSDYRIRYEVDDVEQTVQVLQCKHRKDVYR